MLPTRTGAAYTIRISLLARAGLYMSVAVFQQGRVEAYIHAVASVVCLSHNLDHFTYKIIISIELPKLIFRSAPILSPISRAVHSVAKVNKFESGMIAKAFARYVMYLIGADTRSKLLHE